MRRGSALFFIFLTVFFDLLGAGIILPLLPFYVQFIEGSENTWLIANQALVIGALAASFSLMQFLCAPILGALSDRFGRRPVLLISLAGSAASYVVFGLAPELMRFGFNETTVLIVLFAARIVDGITGGNIATAQAYIADSTSAQDRAKGLGLIGAAFGLGFMLGPALGGVLSQISLALPAFVAAGIGFLNVAWGFFALPESLPAERRQRLPWSRMNPLARLGAVIGRRSIQPLLLGSFLLNFAFAGLQTNFAVYSSARFGYGPAQNAFVFALIGLVAVITQGFLLGKLLPRFGEVRLLTVGLMFMTLAFGLTGVVAQAWMLYPLMAMLAFGSGIATTSLSGLISQRVGAREQGAVLGGAQALTSLTMVLGPLYAGYVFDSVSPSAPYISGSILLGAALLVVLNSFRSAQPTRTYEGNRLEAPGAGD